MLQISIRYFSSKRTGEWMDGWMDEGKREAAKRKEEERNAIPGRETRLTSVQKQEGCVRARACKLVLPVW